MWQFNNVWAPRFCLSSDSISVPNTIPSKVVGSSTGFGNWEVYWDPNKKPNTFLCVTNFSYPPNNLIPCRIYRLYNRTPYYFTAGSPGTPISLSSIQPGGYGNSAQDT